MPLRYRILEDARAELLDAAVYHEEQRAGIACYQPPRRARRRRIFTPPPQLRPPTPQRPVAAAGDPTLFAELKIPESTARTWVARGPSNVVTLGSGSDIEQLHRNPSTRPV